MPTDGRRLAYMACLVYMQDKPPAQIVQITLMGLVCVHRVLSVSMLFVLIRKDC